jgi:hypothetical protein|tara:strand:- start:600 stop:1013 length:414 start_codon:yes stop_codon:yes gene_type:complete
MNDKKLTANEKLVKAYLTIRDERNRLQREYDGKDKDLANDLASIEQVLLNSCNEIGADSMRTEFGTVIKSTKENFVCGDWDNFKKFVLDNEVVELLQQRIHQGNIKEFLSDREDEGLPPGISTMREFKITVRKPTKS